MSLFLCLFGISLGVILSKKSCQKWRFGKKVRGDGHIGGLFVEGRVKPSAHYELLKFLLLIHIIPVQVQWL